MTTLRDDGYLETDDPVVLACFLEREVKATLAFDQGCQPYDEGEIGQMNSVFKDGIYIDMCAYETPILIPAKTVAEVCGYPGHIFDGSELRYLGIAIDTPDKDGVNELLDWLREHGGDDE